MILLSFHSITNCNIILSAEIKIMLIWLGSGLFQYNCWLLDHVHILSSCLQYFQRSISNTNKDLSIFRPRQLSENWPKFSSHITKRRPLESRAESCCVKRRSIWLRLQSSLFLPAQWPSTTRPAIHWWQLTRSTGQGTFAHIFSQDSRAAGTHINMPLRYYSLGYTHTLSLVNCPKQIVLFPHKC